MGGAFVDESESFSSNFTDKHLGGTTTGAIIDRDDLFVTVKDSIDPDNGLTLGASGAGGGTATINICESDVFLTDGDIITATCGSLIIDVYVGPIAVELVPSIQAVLPSRVETTVTEDELGDIQVENESNVEAEIVVIMLDCKGAEVTLATSSLVTPGRFRTEQMSGYQ